jgi:hypothetical protein
MKRMRLKKPVEIVKGHLFVILIVIAISLRCEAASPHSIEKTKKEISLQQSQYSNNTKDGKERLKRFFFVLCVSQ